MYLDYSRYYDPQHSYRTTASPQTQIPEVGACHVFRITCQHEAGAVSWAV